MAIIYTYGFDDNVQDNDAWVGTNSGNRKTKQFSALSVANYMNRYARVSIGGQMSYKLTSSSPGLGEMTVIGGGDGTNFVDIEFLNISTSDLSGAQVTEFLDYLVSTGLLISHQNNPSTFGHYTVVAYTPTVDPSVYKLELGILGGNGKVFLNNYYDLSPLNLAGGTGSGVTTVDTSEGSFITLTPTTPTAGNVLITADLSATGTPDATTFLRGDNTWAVAGEVDGSGTTNYVSKWQDPTTLTDSVIYDNGTNVGIGTPSPTTTLDVNGSITTSGGIIGPSPFDIFSQYTNRGRITLSSGTSTGANQIAFLTNGNVKAVINKEGNVGIGTTSPVSNLHVSGGGGVSTPVLFTLGSNDDGAGTNSAEIRLLDNGTTKWQVGKTSLNDFWVYDNTAGRSVITAQDNGNLLLMQTSGNVGIGTTSPASRLEVQGGTTLSAIGFSGPTIKIGDYTGIGTTRIFSNGSYIGYSTANSYHDFSNAGASQMHITSSGNVGIGTTSPGSKLDVEGRVDFASDIRLRGQDTSLNLGVVRLYVDATNNFFIDPGNAGAALSTFKSTGAVQLGNYGSGTFTGTATQRLAVDSSGNVIEIPIGSGPVDGSGTANYVTKWSDADTITDSLLYDNGTQVLIGATSSVFSDDLYINNSAYAQSGWRVGTTTTYVGKLYNYSGVLALEADGTRSLSLKNTTNGEIVRIDGANSKVGIGTTSPFAKLDVISPDGSTHSLRLGRVDNGNYWHFNHAGNDLRISNSAGAGSDILLGVDSGSTDQGNRVGIGTSVPSQKLHVDGNARLTGAFYDSNNSAGTIGQVLTSTSTSTEWTDPGSITQVPVPITAFAGGSLALAATVNFVYFSWLGGSGIYTLNLPSAVTYPYKVIRFVTDGGTSASNKIHIQGSGGQTVDGGVFYTLDKAYNGVQVWSDGSEWIVIQAKAT